ncbi:recombination endonuclease VII [Planomonospora sphaerica]|uniref:Recombination endonuclease VII n=1 Tax=Planomonospora sphaerica TaxID=161355 RepID=A0A161LIZ2_9ACTN|nr:endonuclease domain-containing protein [Planomonospora sphaerica]GAT68794.1 recombination endonuclease VII [Planomonospora sphaerica]
MLSASQIEMMGGRVCVICERPETYGTEIGASGQTVRREMELWDDPADQGAFLGMICSIKNENGRTVDGCARYLGRVARGTRYGSARRLQQFAHYRDNPLDLTLFLDVQPTAQNRAEASRRRREDGLDITAVQVAALRAAAGHRCQVCRRPGDKDALNYRGPLVIDHDHDTGRWRGLLCTGCNGGMKFLDYGALDDRERYYNNAMWFFTEAVGVRGEPNYDTLREVNKRRRGSRP